jgi:hypothetical protein
MFPGDVLVGPIIRALFGQPKYREVAKPPDDRNYGGPEKKFNGWPNLTYKDPWSR